MILAISMNSLSGGGRGGGCSVCVCEAGRNL